jgi:catecholate siderophore receptor
MKSNTETPLSLRSTTRPDGLAVTGTLLALGQLAAPFAMAADQDKKQDDSNTKVENLGEMVVDATTGKKLYKPEKLASPKYTAPLKDIAQTITVIPKEVIQDQGAMTLTDVLRNVPGISVQAGEAGGASNTAGDAFTLRGFSATNSIFVDGVRNDSLLSRDVYNIESVEAFLGPTGSDVGRGTAGGYVNITTKAPEAQNFYRGSVGFGSADRMRDTFDVNQTLGTGSGSMSWMGTTALRVNGMYQEGGVPGRDKVEKDSWAIAPSLAFGLGTDTRIIIQVDRMVQTGTPDYGVPARNGYPIPGINDEWFYGNKAADFDDGSQTSFTLRLEHDFSENFKLRNQTRYSESDRTAVVTGVGTTVTPVSGGDPIISVTRTRQGNERHNKIFSNQTTLTAKFDTGPVKHSISAGLEYTWDQQESPTLVGMGTYSSGNPILAPFVPNFPDITGYDLNRSPLGYHSVGATDTIGVFVFDSAEIGQHWQVSGGFRADRYDARYYATSAPVAPTPTNAGNPDGLLYGDTQGALYSGKLALTYKPTKEGDIYLAYGSTMTPPGSANFTLSESAVNQNSPNLDPQESWNIELGSKWEFFNDKLSVNGAIFHTENKNVIFTTDPSAPLDPSNYSVDGRQTIEGETLGVTGKITDNWAILANVSHLNAELNEKGNPNNGRDLTLTPELSGSLWTTYQLPWKIQVGGGIRYQDQVEVNAANTIRVPSYAVVDMMAKYEVNERMNIQANVYNLFNRDYRISVNNNGQRYNAGTPLSFMVSTNFSF